MDVQKAYDTVKWRVLEDIPSEMNFPPQFIRWIMLCVSTVSYRYMINGQTSRILKAKRGIRQGDPISPLLFVIVMEYLHRSLTKLHNQPEFKYHPKCGKMRITNICFADDLIMFARGDNASVQSMMEEFHRFSEATGLYANPTKCNVYFGGVPDTIQQQILVTTKFSVGKLPFKYLGVPLASRKLAIYQYEPLIDKIVSRIRHWAAKLLSYAGRLQLIKSVLFTTTNYWMQVFLIPKKVLHNIEAICRTFLWAGTDIISRKSPIAWDKVCYTKAAGGQNVTSLLEWNLATISKLLWNLQAKEDKLWIKWMDHYYIKGQQVMEWQVKANCSWILRKIMQCRERVQQTAYWPLAVQSQKYTTARMYRELRGPQLDVTWKHLIYYNYARPRARFTLWMALLNRLATKDRIARFGVNTNGECCWCKQVETLDHIFFECTTTGFVWSNVLTWLGYNRTPEYWSREKEWISDKTKKKGWKSQLLKIATTETVYEVWRNRNDITFGHNTTGTIENRIKNNIVTRGSMHRKIGDHIDIYSLSII
ncbi:uncharacterized protein LOC131642117 [Vicia villosa]|uniref:uncharacterized protein LOC131642117 n=1 Tax=Vicia villosa TaxID=3911 RepID=UPI00273B8D3D|nr:uncharacterized protein LOC131642117 [Vicia villosa]